MLSIRLDLIAVKSISPFAAIEINLSVGDDGEIVEEMFLFANANWREKAWRHIRPNGMYVSSTVK